MTTDKQVFRPAWAFFGFSLLLVVIATACGKKTPIPPPPPPPSSAGGATTPSAAAPAPVASEFAVEPTTVERGQTALLRWNVTNADSVSIDNEVGTVPAMGTRRIIPAETTTYTLTASGPGGNTSAKATVTVTAPAEPPGPATRGAIGTLQSRVQSDLQDAYFDYDSNNIRDDARTVLTTDADALKRIFTDFPSAVVMVEGYCDERGSAEYNLGLGDRRASMARDFLVGLGVSGDRLKSISYGKERPVCTESTEDCWQRNRRVHFSVGQ